MRRRMGVIGMTCSSRVDGVGTTTGGDVFSCKGGAFSRTGGAFSSAGSLGCAVPRPFGSMYPMMSPTAAFSPLRLSIWVIVPVVGAGSSTVTFSVSMTTTGSSWATVSPGFLSQSPISTSVIDSPTDGTTSSTGILVTYYAKAAASNCSCSFL